ncbi:hypothetical protein AAEP80_17140 [Curtobacterium sp. L3-7]|uniref:hypothetical protein n=1 Tax=Curtobacterium sp. L3-7 TaxID=3138787 RepID=UPI003B52CFB4
MSGEFAGTDGDHGAGWKVPSQVLADGQMYAWNVQVAAPTQPGLGAGYSASSAPAVVRSSDALLPDSLPAPDESAVEGTEATSSGSGSAKRATALEVRASFIGSDKPHYSGGDMSVHRWWTNVGCKYSAKAAVTAVLQRKTNGCWSKIGKGETLKNPASGGGPGKRAAACCTCSGSTKWDWRPYVTVDVYTVKETVPGAHGQTVTQAGKSSMVRDMDTEIIDVAGERFEIKRDASGRLDITWVSGPNENYGFSMTEVGNSSGHPIGNRSTVESEIRSFLADIDPATGFLFD